MQGRQLFVPPHYERKEQIICQIEGDLQVKMVSPIYRQEVYAGKPVTTYMVDSNGVHEIEEEIPINFSPVNFFRPDNL